MKINKTAIILTSLSLVIFSSPIHAQTITVTPTTSPSPTQKVGFMKNLLKDKIILRRDLKETKKEVKDEVKADRIELKATLSQDKKEFQIKRLNTTQNGLLKSFTVRTANLERSITHINSLITKKLEKSKDNQSLKDAQSKLSSVELKTLWDTYKADLAKYESSIKSISSSSNPKELLPELKSQAKKINEDLKAIRSYLVNVLRTVVKVRQ